MNGIVHFRKCTLTNKELIEKVDAAVDSLYDRKRDQASILARNIPARPNDDFDLIVGELIYRFSELTKAKK